MQFNFISITLAALVASAAASNTTSPAGNATNSSNGTMPSPIPTSSTAPESAAFRNAVSGGLLGVIIAGGLALAL